MAGKKLRDRSSTIERGLLTSLVVGLTPTDPSMIIKLTPKDGSKYVSYGMISRIKEKFIEVTETSTGMVYQFDTNNGKAIGHGGPYILTEKMLEQIIYAYGI